MMSFELLNPLCPFPKQYFNQSLSLNDPTCTLACCTEASSQPTIFCYHFWKHLNFLNQFEFSYMTLNISSYD